MKYPKGLLVWLYSSQPEKTDRKYILTGNTVAEVFSPDEKTPELRLFVRTIFNEEHLYCVPATDVDRGYICFSGDFVYTSDSRFPNKYPIPVHRSQPELF